METEEQGPKAFAPALPDDKFTPVEKIIIWTALIGVLCLVFVVVLLYKLSIVNRAD